MDYSVILYEVRDRVALITLNRPEKLNAWTTEMANEIVATHSCAPMRTRAWAACCSGAPGRALSAPAPTSSRSSRSGPTRKTLGRCRSEGPAANVGSDFPSLVKLLHFGKPSIAALHGYAMGIGVTLPMHCDMRIAAESLKLNTQFLNVGLTPEFGSTYLLPRMIGLSKTLELVLLPKTYSAQEALEMGLVNRVVPDDRLMDEAMEVATIISKRPPFAVRKAKETIYQNLDRHWLEALQVEMAVFVECMSTAEHREGIRAFMEKREPDFPRQE